MNNSLKNLTGFCIVAVSISIIYYLTINVSHENKSLSYDYENIAQNTHDIFLNKTCGGSTLVDEQECSYRMLRVNRHNYLDGGLKFYRSLTSQTGINKSNCEDKINLVFNNIVDDICKKYGEISTSDCITSMSLDDSDIFDGAYESFLIAIQECEK